MFHKCKFCKTVYKDPLNCITLYNNWSRTMMFIESTLICYQQWFDGCAFIKKLLNGGRELLGKYNDKCFAPGY